MTAKRIPLRIVLVIVVFAPLSSAVVAMPQGLDGLASQLAKETKKANLKSVGVIDFLDAGGRRSDLGWYLASKLSQDLSKRDREVFDRARLQDRQESAVDPFSNEALKRIGIAWGVGAIVTGSVDVSREQYLISVTIRRTTDGSIVATGSQGLAHSRVLDLLSPEGAESETETPMRAGVRGVGVPQCVQCPVPLYTDEARQARVQSASVVLTVIISAKGIPAKINVVKGLGYGMTEKAIETVSDWKLRPAPGPNGPPVPVLVPIEVVFRSPST